MSMRVSRAAATLVLHAPYGAVEATAQGGGRLRLSHQLVETDAFPDAQAAAARHIIEGLASG